MSAKMIKWQIAGLDGGTICVIGHVGPCRACSQPDPYRAVPVIGHRRQGKVTGKMPVMRASRSRTREATNLLTSTPDEFALGLARSLLTARDLFSLCLACPRFATKTIAGSAVSAAAAAAAAPEMLSMVEEAGRLWVAGCSDQERGWVPRLEVESWLGLMHEVELLRVPLAFGRAHGEITLSEGGAVAVKNVGSGWYRTAASKVVMRSGRHFVRFTVMGGVGDMLFGVIRPGWDVEGEQGAHLTQHWADGHCFYSTYDGTRDPGDHNWEGMQPATEPGDRIGMLLDLDQGSMTVWKNDERLGVMQAKGLSGPYCWAVSIADEGDTAGLASWRHSARIESAVAPASPTEAELAAARAWELPSESDDE